MKQRCFNTKATGWKHYGGRGITVCNEWLEWKTFEAWALSHGYADNLTIDRIDSDGNYEPTNCQWLSLKANARKAATYFPDKKIQCVETGKIYDTITDAAKDVGLKTASSVNSVILHPMSAYKPRKAGGYTWRFL